MNKINKNIDVLQFIELYKSHEVLWNMNLPSYRRNDLKIKAYETISTEMEMSVEDVKKKIKSLRTAYGAEKSKVEKSKKSGCGTDSVYVPTVLWYNEMNFLNSSLIRRTTVDNCNQQKETIAKTLDESSLSESFTDQENNSPACSKKRKRSPEHKSKFDDAVDKLIAINKDLSVYEAFGENVARQVKGFAEEDAYQLMADIQLMLTERKLFVLREKREAKSNVRQSRASTPLPQNFMFDDIIEVEC